MNSDRNQCEQPTNIFNRKSHWKFQRYLSLKIVSENKPGRSILVRILTLQMQIDLYRLKFN